MYVIEVCSKDGNKIGYSSCANMETVCALIESYELSFFPISQSEVRTMGMVYNNHIIKSRTETFDPPEQIITNNENTSLLVKKIYVEQYEIIYDYTPRGSFDYDFRYETKM